MIVYEAMIIVKIVDRSSQLMFKLLKPSVTTRYSGVLVTIQLVTGIAGSLS